ncbi:NUDIX domain-containing protein [Nonomuraea sp. NPDC050663]|uniref:NUDIX hydrolase n=1 Tax=Nonomuraea sp. NPDC050663 TaxID=3364370 RepID=UPI0037A512F2
MTAEPIRASGAVVWRGSPDAPEIAVVHRPRYDDWTFPKGKAKPREHDIVTALREVREETGFTVTLGRRLPTHYYAHNGRPKRVNYWTARLVSGHFTPNDEVDELVWLEPGAARERLTFPFDAALLGRLRPLDTVPLVLVRHGTAGERDAWRGPDLLRPLDAHGLVQARILAKILPAYQPRLLLSSPSLRCVQTLEPYGMPGLEPLLSEEQWDPDKTVDLVDGIRVPAVVCSHGKVLPALAPRHLDKGAFVVRHRLGDRVVAEEYHLTR